MATVNNASPIYDYKRGYLMLNWGLLANGDVGDAFEVPGWLIAGADWQGTIGAGFAGKIEGTNDPLGNPGTWAALPNFSASAAGLLIPTSSYPLYCRWVRPHITAGDGTTSMSVKLMVVSQNPS